MSSIDRLALWNLVTTVDAFLSSGFTPTELMRWVHPSLVASTQGTGMGGMTSMQTMYHGNLLGKNKPNDILQEVLPNVMAGHVVQSYIGSYGAMIHPVGACATTAVSVEEGVDKIRLGKAEFVVAGGYDDLTLEAIIGFGDMSATADTEAMRAKGISDSKFSRGNDRRRLGFVEGQGGGTILLARGDLALEMGLPVLAVVGYVSSFGDGVHTSIPAPGSRRARRGPRRQAVAAGQVAGEARASGADDIAVISKHDTSTLANDPNETELHERLASAMGRSTGRPAVHRQPEEPDRALKGGAAAFQIMGMCQMLRDGVIPPNRSLDCVDEEMAHASHFVWVREALQMREKFPMKAGLDHQPGLRSRVGSGRPGAPAGLPGCAEPRAARGLPAAGRCAGCWRVSARWPRRSPAGPRCTRSRPIVASTTIRRRSGRKRTCCSTPSRGSVRTVGTGSDDGRVPMDGSACEAERLS